MLLTGLTLAFATIPEELPILVTLVLALGALQLARRNAVVKRLAAAEALGSLTVVCADKTGTLTQSRMRVSRLVAPTDGSATNEAVLRAAVIASEARAAADGSGYEGDPLDVALLEHARSQGMDVEGLRTQARRLVDVPFDVRKMYTAVLYEEAGRQRAVVKGAPETVFERCTRVLGDGTRPLDAPERDRLAGLAQEMAAAGLRVIAIAEGQPLPGREDTLEDLTLLGLAAFEDPPREGVAEAVRQLGDAGVHVTMVTGDHPATARAIAARVGIPSARTMTGPELDTMSDTDLRRVAASTGVFARITPEHKLRVVRALQASGETVGVTGDGVNDAPALREAAVGVAMGRGGTDVAREAADLVLADDDFATVTAAVAGGRLLYANLAKAVRFYLGAKLALVLSSLVAVLSKAPVPFEPVQIIVMEMLMDLGASTTFVSEPAERDLMAVPPRPAGERLLSRRNVLWIAAAGASLALAVLVAWAWSRSQALPLAAARTVVLDTWLVGHLVLAASMRTERRPLLSAPLRNNAFLVWGAATIGIVAASARVPFVAERLHTMPLRGRDWLVVAAAGLLIPAWPEAWKWARGTPRRDSSGR
jgi:Ca2+-transporting ATPase